MSATVSPEELRGLFLFEDLDEDQLAWLTRCGKVEEYPAEEVSRQRGAN